MRFVTTLTKATAQELLEKLPWYVSRSLNKIDVLTLLQLWHACCVVYPERDPYHKAAFTENDLSELRNKMHRLLDHGIITEEQFNPASTCTLLLAGCEQVQFEDILCSDCMAVFVDEWSAPCVEDHNHALLELCDDCFKNNFHRCRDPHCAAWMHDTWKTCPVCGWDQLDRRGEK